jgi:hypothetical protein
MVEERQLRFDILSARVGVKTNGNLAKLQVRRSRGRLSLHFHQAQESNKSKNGEAQLARN